MKSLNIPTDAPFNENQRAWLDGFVAGLRSSDWTNSRNESGNSADNLKTIEILFGTQTGNAEGLANDAATLAKTRGYLANIRELDSIDMEYLANIENAIIIVSTYGEGEMPDNAGIFWDSLVSESAPRLESLSFGVLALGDTSYDEFCQAGKLIDTRLEQLGATRISSRIDCDVDFEEPAARWLDLAIPNMGSSLNETSKINTCSNDKENIVEAPPSWNRKNPYQTYLKENRLLSVPGSAKEIRHIGVNIANSGITYDAGDSLGIMPVNSPYLVEEIIKILGVNQDYALEGSDDSLTGLLSTKYEIMTPSKELIYEVERNASNAGLSSAIANKETLDTFLWGLDTLDLLKLLKDFHFSPEQFVKLLRPLQHRAYSISSSFKSFPDEIHLTVAAVRWTYDDRIHNGVASTFLADQNSGETTNGVFLLPNKNFRVPEDDDVPMVMVGPGTGIAPFRAFLQEREERGAKGMNWLFFGDQHRKYDFLYEQELGQMSDTGLLTRLDLAFSRDQKEKIYVQNRMLENSYPLFKCLEEGGHFYVCGDASKMAKDVDKALFEVIKHQGSFTDDQTTDYVNSLKKEKRYLRDVY